MHKFLTGASPPPPKKVKGDTQKEYEVIRNRKFLPKWKIKYPWVEYQGEHQRMFCTYCKKTGVNANSIYVIGGASSFRNDSLEKHDRSELHERAAEIVRAQMNPTQASQGARTMQTLRTIDIEKMKNLFRVCHAMSLKGRPFSDFTWMCQLATQQGVNLGGSYQTDKYCREITGHIAEAERNILVLSFRKI